MGSSNTKDGESSDMTAAEIYDVFRTLQLPLTPVPRPVVQETAPVIVYSITGNSPPSTSNS